MVVCVVVVWVMVVCVHGGLWEFCNKRMFFYGLLLNLQFVRKCHVRFLNYFFIPRFKFSSNKFF